MGIECPQTTSPLYNPVPLPPPPPHNLRSLLLPSLVLLAHYIKLGRRDEELGVGAELPHRERRRGRSRRWGREARCPWRRGVGRWRRLRVGLFVAVRQPTGGRSAVQPAEFLYPAMAAELQVTAPPKSYRSLFAPVACGHAPPGCRMQLARRPNGPPPLSLFFVLFRIITFGFSMFLEGRRVAHCIVLNMFLLVPFQVQCS